jgi:hypothetical protein
VKASEEPLLGQWLVIAVGSALRLFLLVAAPLPSAQSSSSLVARARSPWLS